MISFSRALFYNKNNAGSVLRSCIMVYPGILLTIFPSKMRRKILMLQCRYCDYHMNIHSENQAPFGGYHCNLMEVALNADVERYAEEHPCSNATLHHLAAGFKPAQTADMFSSPQSTPCQGRVETNPGSSISPRNIGIPVCTSIIP